MFWLILAAAIVGLFWYMIKAPGVSYSGPLKPVTAHEVQLAENMSRHIIRRDTLDCEGRNVALGDVSFFLRRPT